MNGFANRDTHELGFEALVQMRDARQLRRVTGRARRRPLSSGAGLLDGFRLLAPRRLSGHAISLRLKLRAMPGHVVSLASFNKILVTGTYLCIYL